MISKLYMGQIVKTKNGTGGDKKCEDWKKSLKRQLFVVHSIQLVQQMF